MAPPATDTDWYDDKTATFGDRLAGARDHAGLSVAALAEQIGVKTQTAQDWEDDVREPRANRLQMLAGLLNVSLGWLLTGRGIGLAEPTAARAMPPNLAALFTELRSLRAQIDASADRLGQIEKQLRLAVRGE